ncbi:hypothetical protein SFRURICE_016559 [Spodoptera frugiperda]|nr:hypothetical protein SFRURICE_016559 [Spodoptera frugiperda]
MVGPVVNIAVSAVNPRGQPSLEKLHSSGIPTQPDNIKCGDVTSATSSMARLVAATSFPYLVSTSRIMLHRSAQAADMMVV